MAHDTKTKDATTVMTRSQPSYYEILNVSPGATRSEIRESYIRLRNTFNVQNQALYSLMDESEVSAQSLQIEEAFAILNDDIRRRHYDQSLGIVSPASSVPPSVNDAFAGNAGRMSHVTAVESPIQGAYVDRTAAFDFVATPVFEAPGAAGAEAGSFPTAVIKPVQGQVRNVRAPTSGKAEIMEKMQQLIAAAEPGDGTLFKRLREVVGVSELEIQERTKVCIEYIRGIESNTFDRLPKPIFVKGFLRSYCKYLTIPDSENLVVAFSEKLENWQNSAPPRK